MYPSRYPRHRSQVSDSAGRIDHFCSTHCLFIWLGDAKAGSSIVPSFAMIWVTDFISGRWISGRTAYYVVGSRSMGPMGAEAIAFDRHAEAQQFVHTNGGQVLEFHQVKTGASAWQPSSG
jgi:nitrous oxide reductase accessory protein NosL